MQQISVGWLYPIILIGGALQAWGPPMNGALRNALTNPWLASLVSFLPIVALLACLILCQPRPLPTVAGISAMPWWAPLGGLVGVPLVNVLEINLAFAMKPHCFHSRIPKYLYGLLNEN